MRLYLRSELRVSWYVMFVSDGLRNFYLFGNTVSMFDIFESNDEVSSVLERVWKGVAVFWLTYCSACSLGGGRGAEKNKRLVYVFLKPPFNVPLLIQVGLFSCRPLSNYMLLELQSVRRRTISKTSWRYLRRLIVNISYSSVGGVVYCGGWKVKHLEVLKSCICNTRCMWNVGMAAFVLYSVRCRGWMPSLIFKVCI